MCMSDVEHMSHLFFDCVFSVECWRHVGLWYDWSEVENANDWLLGKISSASAEEVAKICIVLWGVWFWRNKRVWENKIITSAFAMDNSFKFYSEWLAAKEKQMASLPSNKHGVQKPVIKW